MAGTGSVDWWECAIAGGLGYVTLEPTQPLGSALPFVGT